MDAKDLFLAQHAAVQSVAVGGNPASARSARSRGSATSRCACGRART